MRRFYLSVQMSAKSRKMNMRDSDDGPLPIKMKIKQEVNRWYRNKGGWDPSKKLSDDELIKLSVKELNRILNGLPPADVKRLKHRRRTLKNRGYAANCRVRRLTQKEVLQNEKQDLLDENDRLRQENEDMRQELDTMKKTYEALMNFKNSQTKIKEVIIVKQEPKQ